MEDDPLPLRRPGRPKLGAQRRQAYTVTLEPALADLVRTVGNGSLSAGIVRLAGLWDVLNATAQVSESVNGGLDNGV